MESLLDFVYPELSLMNPATFTIATITTMMTIYLYFIQPSMLIQVYFRVAVRWSGMKMKYTKPLSDGFTFFYGEKGHFIKDQMSILLLHGFSADHFMWAPIVQNISSNVHVVAVDLPGHGFSSNPLKDDDIGFKGQIKRIRQFLDVVNLSSQPLHVVGVSMGGTLAGLFAAEFPQLTGLVTITCPSMKTPVESRLIKQHKKIILEEHGGQLTLDNCPMLPQTAEKLQTMLNISHYYSVKYPLQILKGAVELRKKKNYLFLPLVNLLISEESSEMLEKNVHKILAPTQIIWGQEDWIMDVSGVDVLKDKLPNCKRIDILKECGHAVNLDQPAIVANIVLDFWKQHQSLRENNTSFT
ncbi:monoacylglycerol lipase ABHD6-like [Physella acuta]|uniref:monoacylglycerol lipase ABHD6-like n=1 Tax=Physella acuta TaxID=109671 RepID=UPI0027DABC96|nr:monoacylglycerol lipase ABHD6-like [Physella acuta]XP_059151093.1 monoacylglycerol lipase ABHD6-like [Physella acuta]